MTVVSTEVDKNSIKFLK